MHVGFSPVFMNTANALSDFECFKHELALGRDPVAAGPQRVIPRLRHTPSLVKSAR